MQKRRAGESCEIARSHFNDLGEGNMVNTRRHEVDRILEEPSARQEHG